MMRELLTSWIKSAFDEDIGSGDHSAQACIPENARGHAALEVREAGVIAGLELAEWIGTYWDPNLKFKFFAKDGDYVEPGSHVMEISGSSRSLLSTERIILNAMQRMSAIATHTRKFVDELEGTGTRVLDTRKTTPGLRHIEKWAVRIGGGENHRMGLYDMIMLKDNHIDFAGGMEPALKLTHEYLRSRELSIPIEVETRNLEEMRRALSIGGFQRIMLDNFSLEDTRTAVKEIGGRYETESSGSIGLHNVRLYAECGVTYISVGALTHTVKNLDLSLKARHEMEH